MYVSQFAALYPEMVDALILLDAFGLLPTDSVWTIPITQITEELWFECFDFLYVDVELIALLKILNTKEIPMPRLYCVNDYLYWWAGGTLQVSHSNTVAFKFCSSDNLQTWWKCVMSHKSMSVFSTLFFSPPHCRFSCRQKYPKWWDRDWMSYFSLKRRQRRKEFTPMRRHLRGIDTHPVLPFINKVRFLWFILHIQHFSFLSGCWLRTPVCLNSLRTSF